MRLRQSIWKNTWPQPPSTTLLENGRILFFCHLFQCHCGCFIEFVTYRFGDISFQFSYGKIQIFYHSLCSIRHLFGYWWNLQRWGKFLMKEWGFLGKKMKSANFKKTRAVTFITKTQEVFIFAHFWWNMFYEAKSLGWNFRQLQVFCGF